MFLDAIAEKKKEENKARADYRLANDIHIFNGVNQSKEDFESKLNNLNNLEQTLLARISDIQNELNDLYNSLNKLYSDRTSLLSNVESVYKEDTSVKDVDDAWNNYCKITKEREILEKQYKDFYDYMYNAVKRSIYNTSVSKAEEFISKLSESKFKDDLTDDFLSILKFACSSYKEKLSPKILSLLSKNKFGGCSDTGINFSNAVIDFVFHDINFENNYNDKLSKINISKTCFSGRALALVLATLDYVKGITFDDLNLGTAKQNFQLSEDVIDEKQMLILAGIGSNTIRAYSYKLSSSEILNFCAFDKIVKAFDLFMSLSEQFGLFDAYLSVK